MARCGSGPEQSKIGEFRNHTEFRTHPGAIQDKQTCCWITIARDDDNQQPGCDFCLSKTMFFLGAAHHGRRRDVRSV